MKEERRSNCKSSPIPSSFTESFLQQMFSKEEVVSQRKVEQYIKRYDTKEGAESET
jgi:hypothetical protein